MTEQQPARQQEREGLAIWWAPSALLVNESKPYAAGSQAALDFALQIAADGGLVRVQHDGHLPEARIHCFPNRDVDHGNAQHGQHLLGHRRGDGAHSLAVPGRRDDGPDILDSGHLCPDFRSSASRRTFQ